MRKTAMIVGLVWVMPLIVLCLLFLFLLGGRRDGAVLRELSQEEIRPTLERITGKRLSSKVEDLRAIVFPHSGIDELYVAFQTDPGGCAAVLDEFGGPHLKEGYRFPDEGNNPFTWGMGTFDRGYEFQQRLGVALFDKDLFGRVRGDALERANTSNYPKDSVVGRYLKSHTESESEEMYYAVLVFTDRSIVYISAGKKPKGIYLP